MSKFFKLRLKVIIVLLLLCVACSVIMLFKLSYIHKEHIDTKQLIPQLPSLSLKADIELYEKQGREGGPPKKADRELHEVENREGRPLPKADRDLNLKPLTGRRPLPKAERHKYEEQHREGRPLPKADRDMNVEPSKEGRQLPKADRERHEEKRTEGRPLSKADRELHKQQRIEGRTLTEGTEAHFRLVEDAHGYPVRRELVSSTREYVSGSTAAGPKNATLMAEGVDLKPEWKPLLNPGAGGQGLSFKRSELTAEERKRLDVGYKLHGFNQFASDRISLRRSLPPRVLEKQCSSIQYRVDLPDTSVVIIFYNEAWSTLLRTVHSVLDRSPPHLLKKVILVDDFSTMEHLGPPLDAYVRGLGGGRVGVVRAASRQGLIQARLLGLGHVTTKTVVFLDSHCECAPGWLEPLLSRLAENASNVALPTMHTIDRHSFQYTQGNASSLYVGTFAWSLLFNWTPVQRSETRRRTSVVDPVRNPTMAGGLFAINRDYFYNLGTYDPDMKIWGGENLELSFKIWMCGGTLEMLPCSNVGHVFRSRVANASGGKISINLSRLAAVWLDDYKLYYDQDTFDTKPKDFGDVSARRELRRRLRCHSFAWYLKHVLPEMVIPADQLAHGQISNTRYKVSIEIGRWNNITLKTILPQQQATSWSLYAGQNTVKSVVFCLDLDPVTLVVIQRVCLEGCDSQQWRYFPDRKQLYHVNSTRCAQVDEVRTNHGQGRGHDQSQGGLKLVVSPCNHDDPRQQWLWDTTPIPGPSWRRDDAMGIPVV